MSTSDVVMGTSIVVLGATAAGLLMFGNVSATMNNVGVDQAFQLLSNVSLSSAALHGITNSISHLAHHLGNIGGQVAGQVGHAAAPVIQGMSRVGGQVVGQVGNAAAPVVNQIGQVGGQVVGQVGSAAAPVVNQMGQVGGQVVDAAAPVASEGVQVCGAVCCVSFHAVAGVCQDVCQFETLQAIGNFFCHVMRLFS
jgi:hypothetical protein